MGFEGLRDRITPVAASSETRVSHVCSLLLRHHDCTCFPSACLSQLPACKQTQPLNISYHPDTAHQLAVCPQVLGPHNAANTEPATRPSFSRTTGALLRDSTQMTDSTKQRSAAAASNEPQPVFELGGRFETRSLAGLATELFKDPAFMELCDKGLNGTLQRTKDGATAESRIQELAGTSKCCVNKPSSAVMIKARVSLCCIHKHI